jgi:hypothetical protein
MVWETETFFEKSVKIVVDGKSATVNHSQLTINN